MELTRGQWLESQDSLVPVVLRQAKTKPGVYRLMTSPLQIHGEIGRKSWLVLRERLSLSYVSLVNLAKRGVSGCASSCVPKCSNN